MATITIATLAPASGDEGGKVQFTDSSPVSESTFAQAYTSDFHRCTFNGTVTNVVSPCVVPVAPTEPTLGAFNDTLTGDFQGTGQFAGGAVLVADNDIAPATLDIPYELYEPYTLHVAGCGTGTLILHTEGNLNASTGVWRIVPGSGRGGLLGASGSGTFSDVPPPLPTSGFVTNYVGHVRCRGKHGE